MFPHGNILALHSNPLGVMCQSFFRCEAARALIAAPNLVEGAAIFFTALVRYGGEESSSLFVGPQLGLLRGNAGTVEFRQAQLPFVYQFGSLARAALGAREHPLRMSALLHRLVWKFALGIVGHIILVAHAERSTVRIL